MNLNEKIWLIDEIPKNLRFCSTVTSKDVLLHFFFHFNGVRKTTQYKCAQKVATELIVYSKKRQIITPNVKILIRKILKLYHRWVILKKLKNRNSNCEKAKRTTFIHDMKREFVLKREKYSQPKKKWPKEKYRKS